jgi:diguanylate cyclase (GGDEF)-like protein/PAS domain S-box-containing protein
MQTSRFSFSTQILLSLIALFLLAIGLSFSLWYFGFIGLTLLLVLIPLSIFLVRRILKEEQKIEEHARTLQQSEASHKNLFESSPDAVLVLSNDAVIDCNPAALRMFGVTKREELLAMHPGQLSPPRQSDGEESQVAADRKIKAAMQQGQLAFEWLHHRLDNGQAFIAEVLLSRVDIDGQTLIQGMVRDITKRKLSEDYEQFRSQILEMLAGTELLMNTLQNIVLGVERLHSEMLCSILLLDKEKKHLRKSVAPSLPDFYNDAIDGIEIGLGVGSCGTAAFTGERVIIDDIATHPYWAPYLDLAARADLAACWSQPIRSSSNEVLGTFAIYHRQVNKPSAQDINLIEQCARFASIAIEKNTAAEKLNESEAHYRLLTEDATDVVWKMDINNRFTYISPADERMRGFTADEVVGQHVFTLLTEDGIAALRKKTIERLEKERNGIKTGAMIFDLQQHCKDGRLIWTEVLSNPIRDSQGNICGYQGITRNITNRKFADEALRIAAIAFESQEGMYITNTAWEFLRVNKAFSEITGYSAKEAIGQTPEMLKSNIHDDFFYTEMIERLRTNGAWQGEIWDKRKNGEAFPALLTITVVKDDAGQISHYVGTFTDISSRKTAEDKIKSLAFYDPLTLLPNRRLLMDRLEQALAGGARHQRKGALLFVDLDNFKKLNDTLGHDKGDILLQQVAKRLLTCTRDIDTVARFGGDEFVVMLEDLSEEPIEAAMQAEVVGEKILSTLNQGYQLAGIEHRSTPSVGITLFGEYPETIEEPLKRADLAMYQAKSAGRNTLRFFDPKMQAVVAAHVALEEALREAIVGDQFLIHYQVQATYEGLFTGAEALLRWMHPERGMVSPAEFIPLAEETGLILQLGHWVLESSCTQLATWANDPALAHLTLAVNVSPRQFHQDDFVEQVLDVIVRTGVNPKRLKLELTEGMLVSNVEDVIAKILAIKEHGVDFSLDDFGTGFSSLAYLKRLPLDQLKIDQSFVRDILVDPNDAAISKMVIVLAESLGLSVIAEGVETKAHLDYLASQGCLAYQGYFFSRPLPLHEFESFVKKS